MKFTLVQTVRKLQDYSNANKTSLYLIDGRLSSKERDCRFGYGGLFLLAAMKGVIDSTKNDQSKQANLSSTEQCDYANAKWRELLSRSLR
jgi:hypothetical protein